MQEKWHPLHSFVTSGQSSLVEALIRRGVDINAQNMVCFSNRFEVAAEYSTDMIQKVLLFGSLLEQTKINL
jgi:hypothetical protein